MPSVFDDLPTLITTIHRQFQTYFVEKNKLIDKGSAGETLAGTFSNYHNVLGLLAACDMKWKTDDASEAVMRFRRFVVGHGIHLFQHYTTRSGSLAYTIICRVASDLGVSIDELISQARAASHSSTSLLTFQIRAPDLLVHLIQVDWLFGLNRIDDHEITKEKKLFLFAMEPYVVPPGNLMHTRQLSFLSWKQCNAFLEANMPGKSLLMRSHLCAVMADWLTILPVEYDLSFLSWRFTTGIKPSVDEVAPVSAAGGAGRDDDVSESVHYLDEADMLPFPEVTDTYKLAAWVFSMVSNPYHRSYYPQIEPWIKNIYTKACESFEGGDHDCMPKYSQTESVLARYTALIQMLRVTQTDPSVSMSAKAISLQALLTSPVDAILGRASNLCERVKQIKQQKMTPPLCSSAQFRVLLNLAVMVEYWKNNSSSLSQESIDVRRYMLIRAIQTNDLPEVGVAFPDLIASHREIIKKPLPVPASEQDVVGICLHNLLRAFNALSVRFYSDQSDIAATVEQKKMIGTRAYWFFLRQFGIKEDTQNGLFNIAREWSLSDIVGIIKTDFYHYIFGEGEADGLLFKDVELSEESREKLETRLYYLAEGVIMRQMSRFYHAELLGIAALPAASVTAVMAADGSGSGSALVHARPINTDVMLNKTFPPDFSTCTQLEAFGWLYELQSYDIYAIRKELAEAVLMSANLLMPSKVSLILKKAIKSAVDCLLALSPKTAACKLLIDCHGKEDITREMALVLLAIHAIKTYLLTLTTYDKTAILTDFSSRLSTIGMQSALERLLRPPRKLIEDVLKKQFPALTENTGDHFVYRTLEWTSTLCQSSSDVACFFFYSTCHRMMLIEDADVAHHFDRSRLYAVFGGLLAEIANDAGIDKRKLADFLKAHYYLGEHTADLELSGCIDRFQVVAENTRRFLSQDPYAHWSGYKTLDIDISEAEKLFYIREECLYRLGLLTIDETLNHTHPALVKKIHTLINELMGVAYGAITEDNFSNVVKILMREAALQSNKEEKALMPLVNPTEGQPAISSGAAFDRILRAPHGMAAGENLLRQCYAYFNFSGVTFDINAVDVWQRARGLWAALSIGGWHESHFKAVAVSFGAHLVADWPDYSPSGDLPPTYSDEIEKRGLLEQSAIQTATPRYSLSQQCHSEHINHYIRFYCLPDTHDAEFYVRRIHLATALAQALQGWSIAHKNRNIRTVTLSEFPQVVAAKQSLAALNEASCTIPQARRALYTFLNCKSVPDGRETLTEHLQGTRITLNSIKRRFIDNVLHLAQNKVVWVAPWFQARESLLKAQIDFEHTVSHLMPRADTIHTLWRAYGITAPLVPQPCRSAASLYIEVMSDKALLPYRRCLFMKLFVPSVECPLRIAYLKEVAGLRKIDKARMDALKLPGVTRDARRHAAFSTFASRVDASAAHASSLFSAPEGEEGAFLGAPIMGGAGGSGDSLADPFSDYFAVPSEEGLETFLSVASTELPADSYTIGRVTTYLHSLPVSAPRALAP